jgi:cytosolic carboxypeptidase protein 2/3
MWREFNLINSFTLEASFCGPSKGAFKGNHFNPAVLNIMGRVFCKTLADYVEKENAQST